MLLFSLACREVVKVEWIDGELQECDIEWMNFEAVCEVADNKELLRVRVSAVTEGFHGAGFFDNFQLLKNLTNEKLFGAEIVYIPVDSNTSETPVFGAVKDSKIVSAHIVPKQDIAGSDPPLVLKLIHKQTGGTICTKTFSTGVDAPAYQVTDFGPVDEEKSELEYGQAVSLAVNGGTLPECLLVIQWDVR
jgi:hypothetical protein